MKELKKKALSGSTHTILSPKVIDEQQSKIPPHLEAARMEANDQRQKHKGENSRSTPTTDANG